jgi:hypothetical protein
VKKKTVVKTKSCVLDIKNCTSKQLCARGTRIVNSNFLWQTNVNFKKYVTEAKRRGLSCGVKKKKPIINEMVRSIQKQLNRLGCNAGTADGILGRKTLSALKRWKSAGGNYTTNKIDQRLRSSLFESIYKCSSAQTSSTSKFTGDIRVAALAGNWVVKPNKDFSCKFNGSTIIINRRGLIQTVSGQAVEGTIYPGWNNKSLFINLVIVGKKRYYEKPIEL